MILRLRVLPKHTSSFECHTETYAMIISSASVRAKHARCKVSTAPNVSWIEELHKRCGSRGHACRHGCCMCVFAGPANNVMQCVCMYVCTYVYVCSYVRMYVCMYVCMCVYVCMYVCNCMPAASVCIYLGMQLLYVCIFLCVYVCMYV